MRECERERTIKTPSTEVEAELGWTSSILELGWTLSILELGWTLSILELFDSQEMPVVREPSSAVIYRAVLAG